LAEKGLDIILVSRTLEKLKSVANAIQNSYKVQTKILAVDFTKEDGIYEEIEEAIRGLEIGILVNNVGIAHERKLFHKISKDEKFYNDLIHCNVTSLMQMTRLILPQMVQRRNGLIINISSGFSYNPAPLVTVYAATKAFITKFSSDIRFDYKKYGILVQAVSDLVNYCKD
jgi:short-subunit dehydrogenase